MTEQMTDLKDLTCLPAAGLSRTPKGERLDQARIFFEKVSKHRGRFTILLSTRAQAAFQGYCTVRGHERTRTRGRFDKGANQTRAFATSSPQTTIIPFLSPSPL